MPIADKQETWLETFIDARFKLCADTRLAPLVKELFASAVDTRLKESVDAALPSHIKEALDKALDDAMVEHQNQLYSDCREAEVGIREMVDDASLEIKMALEDSLKEIEALAEDHLRKMAEESETLLGKADTAENELDYLRSRFIKLAESILHRHELYSQKIETEQSRCRSV
ncbi:hypothetical protein N7495_009118 [Penicillium taxi]|uniref:uncharacterized protein n=1 Tax=Penicillium taxi TaxID=168475 RepID=UPI0025454BC5|nr:uncharacterized protein N7495_009118 [Penicillium taxi]KAJ5889077.1 hypothetical protein N7495_009118 [Penicillium taxi]